LRGSGAAEQVEIDAPSQALLQVSAYAERRCDVANYVTAFSGSNSLFNSRRLYDRLGLARRGPWVRGLFLYIDASVFTLALPAAVQTLSGDWSGARVGVWALITLTWTLQVMWWPGWYRSVLIEYLSLHRAIRNPDDVARLAAWDRRWDRYRIVVPAAVAFTLAVLAPLEFLQSSTPSESIAWGNVVVVAALLYGMGELACTQLLGCGEASLLSRMRFKLYSLSPLDTVAVRRSVHASTRLAVGNGVAATVNIGLIALLVPLDSHFLLPLTGVTLLVSYTLVILLVLTSRHCVFSIVSEAKYRTQAQLQAAIDRHGEPVASLSVDEQREAEYLRGVHNEIRVAPVRLPVLSDALRIFGSLVLPTVAFFASVFAQSYLQVLIEDWIH
jgi:hypothetical protein